MARTLDAVTGPLKRTGQFYARTWRDFLDREPNDLPVGRPTVALAAQAFRDEIVLMGLRVRRPISDPHAFERIEKEVLEALDFYGNRGWLDNPEGFFTEPPPLTEVDVHSVRNTRRRYERLSFVSGYRPIDGEPGSRRWATYSGNNLEYALLLRHAEPRPWLVCVHGTEMGRAAFDLAVFRAWHLYADLGLNVVMPVLPMHGPRKRGLRPPAVYPGEDVMDDVHATAQAVWDIRRLRSWIASIQPGSPVGIYGLSLGGYVASLVASLERDLTCAILGVPVANLIDVLTHHASLDPDDPRRLTLSLAEPIGQMVSPLSLSPRVAFRGRFIYAGVADQLVHPRAQVQRLWEHWGKPEIVWYKGGHTGFLESRPVQRFVDAALKQSGLLDTNMRSLSS